MWGWEFERKTCGCEKGKKDAAKLERKSDKNVLNDLQKKVSELAQSNKDLEDDVSVKLKLKMLHARSLRASNKQLKPNWKKLL